MNHRVKLIWTSHSRLDIGQQVQPHKHFCCQLYYILSGAPDFIIENQLIHVLPKTLLFIPEATVHRVCPIEKEPVIFYELKLLLNDPVLVQRMQTTPSTLEDSGLIMDYLTHIIKNSRCNDSHNQEDIEHILIAILLRFFLQDLCYEELDSNLINTENYDSLARSIITYIEKNYTSRLSLQKMSEALNYNKNYLSASFTKQTGITVIDYLKFVRIRQAVIFLIYYNQDIYTTSECVGFSSTSYFTRTFKSLVGIAPLYMRQAFCVSSHGCISDFFSDNHTLNYKRCTIEEGFQSLRDIGQTAISILERKD